MERETEVVKYWKSVYIYGEYVCLALDLISIWTNQENYNRNKTERTKIEYNKQICWKKKPK